MGSPSGVNRRWRDDVPNNITEEDIVAKVSRALDAIEEDWLRTSLDSALSLTRAQWAYCPDCRSKVQVDTPDYKGMWALLRDLIGLVKGQAAVRVDHTVEHIIRQVPMSEMTDAELDAIIEGRALPPAPA